MRKNKVCGVYKITNTVTCDFYIGSSKDVKRRWCEHKNPSVWNRYSNYPLYSDMQKYGTDKFDFQILEEVEIEHLKEKEQQFIEMLKPTYNNHRAKGIDIERIRKSHNEYQKEYYKSEKGKEIQRKSYKKYKNQLCSYNGEILTLIALTMRFQRAEIEHPTVEAKKYLITKQ